MARNVHLTVFERHFKSLETGLQMDSLYSMFVQKGLLQDVRLSQIVKDAKINIEKTRAFLDAIRNSLLVNNNEMLMKFLEALKEYAEETDDKVVNKLYTDVHNDLHLALTSEPLQHSVPDAAGKSYLKLYSH